MMKRAGKRGNTSMNRRKWNRRDLIMLFERLGMYISAGLAPIDALSSAGSGVSEKQKAALETVEKYVEQGGLLSKSLREQMKISPTIAGLIEQGEDSGELAKALTSAKAILEREDALIKTCLSAMAYPSIIGMFAILMTIGLMKGVMPQIIPLLESLHVQLPILTVAVIFLSENLIKYGAYVFLAAFIIIPSAIYLYKKVRRIRFLCHSIILCMPIIGRLARYYSLALTVRSLGSLVESGAALGESYSRVAETAPLLSLRSMFEKKSSDISRGVPLGAVLSGMKRVPPYIAPLVSAGEASGTLGISLMRAADILDRDIEHALKRLTALVEPVMMAGMGCAVGAIALSIMMPIYDVSKALQH